MRTLDISWTLVGMAIVVLLLGLARADRALAMTEPVQAQTPNTACGFALSDAVFSAWRDDGAESGRLGCATARETATSTSPQGSAARAAVFGQNGEIILHVTGPRAGQAYVVSGCFYRLYVQFGGTSGWLGLPVAPADNTPDGSVQSFEGGSMRYTRAYDDCEATPASPAAPVAPVPGDAHVVPLDIFENAATGDRRSLGAEGSVIEAVADGYLRLRAQARVLADAAPGATRLKLFENEASGLKETLATAQSESDALAAGYVFEAGQGWIWTDPRPGAVPLKLFRDPATGRTRLTAGARDESEAAARGFTFVRIEGYAEPPP